MNAIRCSHLAAALAAVVLTLPSFTALGQSGAPALAVPDLSPAASSPPAAAASAGGPRVPRPRGAAETGNRAVAPGDLHPERPVAPQISIPLGRTPPPPSRREERAVERGGSATRGGVDDAAARCDSLADEPTRATCRARLARDAKARLPN